MKILFDHPSPFFLAHGGFQTQIEQTRYALESLGVEVEWLRWWDDKQKGDIIHYFGVPSLGYLHHAHTKKIPVVLTHLFTATCNRPDWKLILQGAVTRSLLKVPGWGLIKNQLIWRSLRSADKVVVGLDAEKYVLKTVFGLPQHKIAKVPLGLDEIFLKAPSPKRDGDFLVTTGTITERKRSIELAQMAISAEVPLLFVGKPYSDSDPYWLQFVNLVDSRLIRYQPHVDGLADMIAILGRAKGFVIYSQHENWCLSAHEAAACGLPLLVPDQKWSRERFGEKASYLKSSSSKENYSRLKAFYQESPRLPVAKESVCSWADVAEELLPVYDSLLPRN